MIKSNAFVPKKLGFYYSERFQTLKSEKFRTLSIKT